MNVRLVTCVAVFACLSMLAGSASAADMEVARQVPPPVYEPQIVSAPFAGFSGCFAGGNAGGDLGRWQLTEFSPFALSGSQSSSGIVGGGQVGCDYQLGSWVLGVQGMLDAAGIKASNATFISAGPPPALLPTSLSETWLATTTGRFGYAVIPPLLLYGRGGMGFAQGQNVGWTAGAGIEWRLLPEFSVFLEYDYLGFGSRNSTYFAPGSLVPITTSATLNVQALLGGLNYRFYLGPPVTTRN